MYYRYDMFSLKTLLNTMYSPTTPPSTAVSNITEWPSLPELKKPIKMTQTRSCIS